MSKHVLVIGHPKGGTSVMFNMLCAAYPDFGHASFEKDCRHDLDIPGNRISKKPLDSIYCREIIQSAKSAGKTLYVITVLRDPRDVVVSLHDPRIVKYTFSPKGYTNIKGRCISTLEYLTVYKGLKEWQGSHSRLIHVRYEDLVRHPQRIQRAMEVFLDQDATGLPFKNFHEADNLPMKAGLRASPLTTDMIGRWRKPEHAEQIREMFFDRREMLDAIVDMGYESNHNWIKEAV